MQHKINYQLLITTLICILLTVGCVTLNQMKNTELKIYPVTFSSEKYELECAVLREVVRQEIKNVSHLEQVIQVALLTSKADSKCIQSIGEVTSESKLSVVPVQSLTWRKPLYTNGEVFFSRYYSVTEVNFISSVTAEIAVTDGEGHVWMSANLVRSRWVVKYSPFCYP